jgi:hypothetical protein
MAEANYVAASEIGIHQLWMEAAAAVRLASIA